MNARIGIVAASLLLALVGGARAEKLLIPTSQAQCEAARGRWIVSGHLV